MKTRALIAAFALSAIVLGSGVSAFAYNGYHNYGNHAGMYAVSPEKQGAYDAMMKDYYSRVSPIQDKLNAKGIELDALSRNPNAKPETISKLAKGKKYYVRVRTYKTVNKTNFYSGWSKSSSVTVKK